jgi:hypothetical protein
VYTVLEAREVRGCLMLGVLTDSGWGSKDFRDVVMDVRGGGLS